MSRASDSRSNLQEWGRVHISEKCEPGPIYRPMATTPAEQTALKKFVANWVALIDQRLAASDMPMFPSTGG